MIRAVIFDADDTLWQTEALYDLALDRAQALMEEVGVCGAEWRHLQRAADLDAVREHGYSVRRFPTSSVVAYRKLSQNPDAAVEQTLYAISSSVFEQDAQLVADVEHVLSLLVRRYQLAVLTKGDPGVQRRRMSASGLSDYFDAISIVKEKYPETFCDVCDTLSTHPSAAVSVGNSVKSDILPALRAGLHAVWIDAHVWPHEAHVSKIPPNGALALNRLEDLPATLEALSAEKS